TDPVQKATFLRYMAVGLQQAGSWKEAIEAYLKLAELEEAKASGSFAAISDNPFSAQKSALEKVDRSHLARRDCWIQARLGQIRSDGGAAAAEAIDKALATRLEEAKKDTSFDALKRFVALFGNQPQGAAARIELVQRMTQAGRLMEAEL